MSAIKHRDAKLLARLEIALSRLPPRRRNIFLMSRVDQLTYAEIAAIYGIPVAWVRRHVTIAMRVIMLEVWRGQPQPRWRRWSP